jgi:6-phosphogluconolactonase (cycloisomerase 2 family)
MQYTKPDPLNCGSREIEACGAAFSPFSPSFWISVHPSGKFAYGTEPGASSDLPAQIATYSIDDSTGALTSVSSIESSGEKLLAFSPSGHFVYGPIESRENKVYMGSVDPGTGALTNIGTVGAGANPQRIAVTATYR